jgi:cysteine-rich repeat protein
LAQCGDGLHHTVDTGLGGDDPIEACDDGNLVDGDGCSEICTVEDNCPNGVVQVELGEECDDNNDVDNDYCSNACQRPFCGDNVEAGGEECDDGNKEANDACTNDCTDNVCGDGILLNDLDDIFEEGEELCDDGNGIPDDTCNDTEGLCIPFECGDGVVQIAAGEECVPGRMAPSPSPTAASAASTASRMRRHPAALLRRRHRERRRGV